MIRMPCSRELGCIEKLLHAPLLHRLAISFLLRSQRYGGFCSRIQDDHDSTECGHYHPHKQYKLHRCDPVTRTPDYARSCARLLAIRVSKPAV
ncbi:hypothetical protein SAMN02745148_02717 [Modicisalibacter ilicicola DSM 19980]|uniref:Uncharacterized protein n=1 Tax=Modicisalibacter ilicicola DSM 19980 TaxID=1121942 RepID=A0A1M5BX59_9GAMM|nr:hypothetical protein SAMN02745148_02717 [Halomonas ilicicola DSM 19980]